MRKPSSDLFLCFGYLSFSSTYVHSFKGDLRFCSNICSVEHCCYYRHCRLFDRVCLKRKTVRYAHKSHYFTIPGTVGNSFHHMILRFSLSKIEVSGRCLFPRNTNWEYELVWLSTTRNDISYWATIKHGLM